MTQGEPPPETPENELDALFDRAVELDAEGRASLLAELRAHQPLVARQLSRLLAVDASGAALPSQVAEAMPDLLARGLAGTELSGGRLGPYLILRRLGGGGGGEVFLAERDDGRFDRQVAIKVLRTGHGEEARRRFLHEQQILAELRHPGIATLHDAGLTDDGRPYFVLELVDGEPLVDYCRNRDLGREARLRLVLSVLDAVHAAHRLGVIHRDLKPNNILVEERDDGARPVVLDFGISRGPRTRGETVTGAVIGTPGYMAPEQARGKTASIDRRCDVFALGVMLYELLCGELPFIGDTPPEAMLAVLQRDPRPPRELDAKLPRDLETVVLRCLEKEPERRYGSVRELAGDLERFLDGRPVQARRVGPWGRLWRQTRRRPRSAALILLASGAVLTAAGIALSERRNAVQRATLAEQFGRQSQALVSAAQLAHLRPPHDLTEVYRDAEEKLAELRANVAKLDPATAGVGRTAIGMAELRLGRFEAAIDELELAWNAEHRPPEAALALGQAYSELYQRRVSEARLLRDDLRTAALEDLSRQLAPKAKRYLGLALDRGADAFADSNSGEPALLEARLALSEGNLERALQLSRQAREASPQLADAFRLEGEVLTAMADDRYWGDTDPAAATELAEQAKEALLHAQDRARSDPRIAQARCDLETLQVALAPAEPEAIERTLGELERVCRATSDLLAERPEPWLRQIDAAFHTYFRLARLGARPLASRRLAVDALERARQVAPEDSRVLAAAADVAQVEVSYAADFQGQDPLPFLELALSAARRAELVRRDRRAVLRMAEASIMSAVYHESHGLDPRPPLRAAGTRLAAALAQETEPTRRVVYLQKYGTVLARQIVWEGLDGGDAESLFLGSKAALEEALELHPEDPSTGDALAHTHLVFGNLQGMLGGSGREYYARAAELLSTIVAEAPERIRSRRSLFDARMAQARVAFDAGENPSAFLAAAEEAGEPLRLYAQMHQQQKAMPLLFQARWRLHRGDLQAARDGFDAALEAIRNAHLAFPEDLVILSQLAEIHRTRLEAHHEGLPLADPQRLISRALALTAAGLERFPSSLVLGLHRIGLLRAAAKSASSGEQQSAREEEARRLTQELQGRYPALRDPLLAGPDPRPAEES